MSKLHHKISRLSGRPSVGFRIHLLLHFSFVLIGERLVSGAQILEPGGGLWVVRVAVGVHLLGQLAVRLLDLVLVGIAPHAQDLVEVPTEMGKLRDHWYIQGDHYSAYRL